MIKTITSGASIITKVLTCTYTCTLWQESTSRDTFIHLSYNIKISAMVNATNITTQLHESASKLHVIHRFESHIKAKVAD